MSKHTFRGDMQRSQKEKNNDNSLMFQTLPNSFELSKNCKTSEKQGHRETYVLHTAHILIFDNNQTFKNHTRKSSHQTNTRYQTNIPDSNTPHLRHHLLQRQIHQVII